MAFSASLLVRDKYLSRISWARRKLYPVMAAISGTVHLASASIVTVVPRFRLHHECEIVLDLAEPGKISARSKQLRRAVQLVDRCVDRFVALIK